MEENSKIFQGYSIFCDGIPETYRNGLSDYDRKMVERTVKQITLLDRKHHYDVKKVEVTFKEID